MGNDDNNDLLGDVLRQLPKDLREWDMSLIRSLVAISGEIRTMKLAHEELKKSAASRVEVWWLRFLFFTAMSAIGALAIALLPGILFKGHA